MKLRSSLLNVLIVIIALSPLAFLAVIWNRLPEIVPVHYDLQFNPNRMGNKKELWLMNGLVSASSIFIYFLLTNLYRIDPKRTNQQYSVSFKRMAMGIVGFMTVLNFLILLSVNNSIHMSAKWLFVLLGLLMAFIGNYFNNLKPNYFTGIRLPWTLSSDYNWKKTHQLAGKLWFWGGLLMVIVTLLIPAAYLAQTFFAMLGIMVIIPTIYSYRLFKQEKMKSMVNN